MKSLQVESSETRQLSEDDTYYMLTLDPTQRDHRILALLIDYTSWRGECVFYRPDDRQKYCSIAPRFKILGRDCSGKCFVNGLTCPIIIEYLEDQKSEDNGTNE